MHRACSAVTLSIALIAAGCKSNDDNSGAMGSTGPRGQDVAANAGGEKGVRVPDLSDTKLAVAKGGPAQGKRDEKLAVDGVFRGPLPTVIAYTSDGRRFVSFPRWGVPSNYTVAEDRAGKLTPFPDAEINAFYPQQPDRLDPKTHLVSVQSVVVDSEDRIWLVDTGSINFGPIIPGGAKLWAYDKSGKRVAEVNFKRVQDGGVLHDTTYLNDVRFDLKQGERGFAYVTDSGVGGIIVIDLATGESWRKLDGHPSVKADTSIELSVEGQPLLRQSQKPEIHSDGIALSPDGATLYYTPLTGRGLYAVPTAALRDRQADAASQVRKIANKPSANDGLWADEQGRIYSTDFEDNAIRRYTPSADGASATEELIVQDERLLWPDCVLIHDGSLYVTSNQLHRQPQFQGGLEEPFAIFRYPLPR